jgi:uncharacterized membrane protein
MTWLLFSILAAFAWGVGQVLLKKGYESLSTPLIYVIDSAIQALFFVPFALIMGFKLESWVLVLLLSLGTVVGNWFYYYAL